MREEFLSATKLAASKFAGKSLISLKPLIETIGTPAVCADKRGEELFICGKISDITEICGKSF